MCKTGGVVSWTRKLRQEPGTRLLYLPWIHGVYEVGSELERSVRPDVPPQSSNCGIIGAVSTLQPVDTSNLVLFPVPWSACAAAVRIPRPGCIRLAWFAVHVHPLRIATARAAPGAQERPGRRSTAPAPIPAQAPDRPRCPIRAGQTSALTCKNRTRSTSCTHTKTRNVSLLFEFFEC